MEKMKCSIHRKDGLLILRLKGYLNEDGRNIIRQIMAKLSFNGIKQVLFNMSECLHINSAGISSLIDAADVLGEREIMISFCNLTPLMKEAFRMVGLVILSKTFETEKEALESFKR